MLAEVLNPYTFDFNKAPLSNGYTPAAVIATYLVAIYGIERYTQRNAVPGRRIELLKKWQARHNLNLSLFSAAMVAVQSMIMVAMEAGALPSYDDYIICPRIPGHMTGPLGWMQYIFYLTKYWELMDTLLQISKGRRPPSYYFHVWHHTAYLAICWAYCKYTVPLASASVIVNGSIHVLMYYYYYLQVQGIHVTWKSVITRAQIIQFITGYVYFVTTAKRIFYDKLPCNAQMILWIHAGFNLTMLTGFIRILSRVNKEFRPPRGKID